MTRDFSWTHVAADYEALYRRMTIPERPSSEKRAV